MTNYDDIEIRTESLYRQAEGPPIRECTVVNTRDKSTRTITALRAEGLQVSCEDISSLPELPPFVNVLMPFGQAGLFVAYSSPDDLLRMADGLRDAAGALRELRDEWEAKRATEAD